MEVVGLSLAENFWMAKACWKGNRKQCPRDRVIVEDEKVYYILWRSTIATWNRKQNTLQVGDCGWKKSLTFNRLNSILAKLSLSIRSIHSVIYLLDSKRGVEYRWEGTHTIQLNSNDVQDVVEICPCVPRRVNVKGSLALQKYYASAVDLMNKQKVLIDNTVDGGIVCLCPNKHYGSHFSTFVLGLSVNNDGEGLRVFSCRVACSKLYSAFMKNNAASLVDYICRRGMEICGLEILSALKGFSVDMACLPQKVLQQLALLKLLEA
jgi:hypothetical protein